MGGGYGGLYPTDVQDSHFTIQPVHFSKILDTNAYMIDMTVIQSFSPVVKPCYAGHYRRIIL